MPRAVRKLSDSKYLVPVVLDKGKYPRIAIPSDIVSKFEWLKGPFVVLEVQENVVVIRKARVVEE